ncbi:YceI family protein [Nonomuraea helvata]|uniref:YceI family protein n=1 Tax=Nonomuraea helvata TaxID=37484 RepID=A0ABV5S8T2_9ACTN
MTPQIGHYTIDTAVIAFRTRHLFGLGAVNGTFALRAGTVDVTEPVASSHAHVEIDAGSFHTGNPQRDAGVRSSVFLDADRHPVIALDLDGNLTGTLTVRGVSAPITLELQSWMAVPSGFSVRATARVDRVALGVRAKPGLAARHLYFTVEATCLRS